ncbi:GGDEF domain-containing protein [Marinobacter daepoensis]|uniref:diguanylate cyclase n=1 Tax=Marinobacter daepoensis TaxID=262077 RepID=A0ABS3BI97_9GAMM|nr:GGDEF domain-containing protein [Marinobacter daepoensis]MBN7771558.1 GGDEF domain-containing protein [Marinobacter daepoensis]MBY6080158.1 GGDEF domain-containing protein [Marinobacter daepoensis]
MPDTAEKFLPGKFSRSGFIAFGLTTGVCLFLGEMLAAVAAAAAAGLCLAGTNLRQDRQSRPWPQLRAFFLIALTLTLIASLWLGPWSLSHWLYALPLVFFAMLPTYLAATTTVLLLFLILAGTQWAVTLPDRHQMMTALVLTTLLSAILVFMREYKSRQLAPLRRTDELTQAASREYLSADLHKEIQRSEREGTHMSVMMIGLDTHLSDTDPDEDIRAILPRIGRYLHSQLRDFDTYYRVADLQFLVILPGANTAEAARTAEQIRQGLSTLLDAHGLKLTVSTGVTGLNIGDDADSLQQSVANALRRAQQQGGNRTQTYSNPVPTDADVAAAKPGQEASQ